jgi:hypothetical protein
MTIDYPSDIWTVFIWMIVTLALFLSAVSFEAIMMKCLGCGNWKASFSNSFTTNIVSTISTIILIYIPGLKFAVSLDGFLRPALIIFMPAMILLTVVASTFIKVCILSYTRRKPLPKLLWAAIITTNSISSITYFFLVAAGLMRLLEILLQQKT